MSNFIRKKVRFSVGSPVKVVRGVCRALESRIMSKNRWIVDETEYYRAYRRTSTEKMAYDPDNQRPTQVVFSWCKCANREEMSHRFSIPVQYGGYNIRPPRRSRRRVGSTEGECSWDDWILPMQFAVAQSARPTCSVRTLPCLSSGDPTTSEGILPISQGEAMPPRRQPNCGL